MEIGDAMKAKRSSYKVKTKEGQILRFMRQSRALSMRAAAHAVNKSDSVVSHYEHGRTNISEQSLSALILAYGYTRAQFDEYLKGKEIPLSIRDECIALIERLDPLRLQTIYPVLARTGVCI